LEAFDEIYFIILLGNLLQILLNITLLLTPTIVGWCHHISAISISCYCWFYSHFLIYYIKHL